MMRMFGLADRRAGGRDFINEKTREILGRAMREARNESFLAPAGYFMADDHICRARLDFEPFLAEARQARRSHELPSLYRTLGCLLFGVALTLSEKDDRKQLVEERHCWPRVLGNCLRDARPPFFVQVAVLPSSVAGFIESEPSEVALTAIGIHACKTSGLASVMRRGTVQDDTFGPVRRIPPEVAWREGAKSYEMVFGPPLT